MNTTRNMADIIGFTYAAIVAGGGIFGYFKAGSIPSLAAGVLFGGLAGFGAYQTTMDSRNVSVTLATSTVLTGLMGYRFLNSMKFMPAGLVASLSLMMLIKSGYRMYQQ